MRLRINEQEMISDFEKVINSLNSSTKPEHLVTSDRMLLLANKKWIPVAKRLRAKENLDLIEGFAIVYNHQKLMVGNRLGLLG